MAELTGLSVRVSAATASFRRGINSAQESAQDLALSLRRLGASSSSAERDLDSMGRSAVTTAASLGGLSIAATNSSTAFLGLSIATVTALVPALITLSSVLFPIVGALTGFVAIAGAVLGVGLIGAIAAIAVNTERLKEQFTDLLATLQDAFAPAIETATAVLEVWMSEFEDIIPQLVPTTEELEHMGGMFANLGEAIIELLPAFVDLGIALTRDFLPGFIQFVEDIGPQLPGMIQGLVTVFREMVPEFRAFGRFLRQFLPEFTQFGFLVLNTIMPAISFLGNAFIDVTRGINNLSNELGSLIAAGSIAAPILIGMASLLGGPITAAIALAVGAIVGLAKAWDTNFAGIRDHVETFGSLLKSVMPAAKEAIEAFLSGVDLESIRNEFSEWATVLDTELNKSLTALKPVFKDIRQLLKDNQEEFNAIGRVVGLVVRGLINLSTAAISVLGPAFRNIVIPVFRGFIDIIDFGLTKLMHFIQLAEQIKAGDISGAVSEANQLFGGGPNPELNLNMPDAQQSQQLEERIEVVVEEDTDLTEARIRRTTNERLTEEQRQTRRNSGRNPNPR